MNGFQILSPLLCNRAMALSISLMFGRLGGVAGSNTAALLLDNHCETTFYISGASLLGKIKTTVNQSFLKWL